MKRFFNIYRRCVVTAFSAISAYRGDFILNNLIILARNIVLPLITFLIYQSGASFPGWSMYEVLLIQAIYMMANGLNSMALAETIWQTMYHIREGMYEVILLRPLNPLFYLIVTTFSPENMGVFAGGLMLFIFALSHMGAIAPLAWVIFLLVFLGGTAVLGGFSLITAAITFKWVGNSRVYELWDSTQEFAKYPLGIFPQALQFVLTFIIPVGMVGFFPAGALLGRQGPEILWLVLPCVLFLLFGIWLYQAMIKHYEGVGG